MNEMKTYPTKTFGLQLKPCLVATLKLEKLTLKKKDLKLKKKSCVLS